MRHHRHVLSALLVGDRRFISTEDSSWFSEGPKGPETGERYLRCFDHVTVAGRLGNMNGLELSCLNRVGSHGVEVVTLPNLSGISTRLKNLREVRGRLRELISQHDAVIARMPTQLGLEATCIGAI